VFRRVSSSRDPVPFRVKNAASTSSLPILEHFRF
jgi:hypothetical protein